MDEAARKALIEEGSEDAVTVNQRALVDKLLARYASEFTVFRELIQNADDANATCCQLKLESVGYDAKSPSSSSSPPRAPNLKAPLAKWIWRNDGHPFRDQDWHRLRRIAEGNPDPDRIGAFGVGFYSLFSICDEPVVASGDELMGFFWKNGGDSLFTRRAKNPAAAEEGRSPSGNPWTSFFMTLREAAPLPESILALARFLATSLTFTAKVRTVELWMDGHRLCKVDKTLESTRPMVMPSHLNAYSPDKMMRVEKLESQGMQITVDALALVWEGERERIRAEREKASRPSLTAALTKSGGLSSMLQSAFGRSKPSSPAPSSPRPSSAPTEDVVAQTARLLTSHSAKAYLKIATAHLDVKTDSAFKREIERSTKKPPPTRTAFHVVFANKDDYDASQAALAGADDVGPALLFEGLMPKLDRMGHVFIGFRTHQTTGFAGHVAARFLPTVERESIDFVDRYCARWNMELLAIGGYTCRAVYEAELEGLRKEWGASTTTETTANAATTTTPAQDRLLARALHTMKFFTMRDSSPSQRVSSTFLATFFSSSRQNVLSLASTQGIKTSSNVRLPNAVLLEFVKRLPIVPPSHIEEASEFFDQVRGRNLVKDVTLEDVFGELSSRSLEVDEMVACLRWWINVSAHPGYDARLRARLIDSAVVTSSSGSPQALSAVRHYLNPQRVPSDVPLPPTCLIYEVSKHFTGAELARVYGWGELSIPAWLEHLATLSTQGSASADENLQLSPAFAEKILGIVARSWGNLSAKQQQEAATILRALTCLPTRKGMQKPEDAYFSNVSLFEDLAIVELPTASVRGNLEKVLVALGVRRHVDLQLIFTRLVGGGDWSHVELLTYLAANRESLSAVEVDRLKKTPIWPKEGEAAKPPTAAANGTTGKPKVVRHRASQLYEPIDSLRALGLPLLDWTGAAKAWRSTSDEAKFAIELGLRRHPPLELILELAASTGDEAVSSKALAYFLERQHYRDAYKLNIAKEFAFVPCRVAGDESAKTKRLKPTEVFTNEAAAVMGFAVVATGAGSGLAPQDVPKLQLRSDPPSSLLVSHLVNDPPKTVEQARKVFEYLASVSSTFSSHDLSILKQAAFVPVISSTDSTAPPRLVPPTTCYFGGNDTVDAFRSVFQYAPTSQLGATACAFLRLVGVSDEPGIDEVATRLVADPGRFYSLSGSTEAYTGLLRQVATNWGKIRAPLRDRMKRSAWLLGSRRVKEAGPSSSNGAPAKSLLDDDEDADDDDSGMLVHSLRRPSEIVIVDDANAGMIFGSSLYFAPHEDLLEQSLYLQLGSPRLSQLVTERYEISSAVARDTKRTQEVKALVLERTPLFLFECKQSGNRAEIRKDAEWLKGALDVVEVGGEGLRLSRTLQFLGETSQDVQRCSAMAQIEGRRLVLFVAANMHLDWFEVASSLNKFLLARQRLQEVLLFMTLLSTSLRDLKRRGFHVDKILQQRKAEREALERARMEEQRRQQLAELERPSEKQVQEWKGQVLGMFPDAEPEGVERALRQHRGLEKTTDEMLTKGYAKRAKTTTKPPPVPPRYSDDKQAGAGQALTGSNDDEAVLGGREPTQPMPGGFFSNFRNRFGGGRREPGPSSLAAGTSSLIRQPQAMTGGVPTDFDGPSTSNPNPGTQAEQPSSLSSIRRNVLSAVSASRPDASTSMNSETRTATQVKEAESSYCDMTSGVAADLSLAGEVAGMRVFLSPELEPGRVMMENRARLEELIRNVYRPVGAIFGLDPESVQVFVDTKGPTIAFNRGGTIWLNYRFAAAWFWDEQQPDKLLVKDALISTFFTMAHELAHNKVTEHGSAHEFWSSALAEHFFLALAKYIDSLGE